MFRFGIAEVLLASLCLCATAHAVDLDQLREEVKRVREELSAEDDPKLNPVSMLDQMTIDRYGPNQAVTSQTGKLQVKGLLQVWYQHIDKASRGNFIPTSHNNLTAPEAADTYNSDTYRIRRTELHFSMTLNDYIAAYVMMDPAREANVTFLPVPTYPNHNFAVDNFHVLDGSGQQVNFSSKFRNNIKTQLLQDAYIEFFNCLPHHEFQIGTFKPPAGEEAWRNSGQLDFVERAMVTYVNNQRDLGIMVHGSWWESGKSEFNTGRIQYWAGVFDGPDGTVLRDPDIVAGNNQSDDNNDKDIAWRLLVRPLWDKQASSGRLEFGIARTDGFRGQASSGADFDPARQINGINRERIAINRQSAWMWYRPNGILKGSWFRSEYGSGHDQYAAFFPTGALATGSGSSVSTGSGFFPVQLDPMPVTARGAYASTGYDIAQSPFAESLRKKGGLCKMLANTEFDFRWETYQNIATENVVNPDRKTDLFYTTVWTAGMNYYLKSDNSKFQMNYIWVVDPSEPFRGLHKVNNNQFVINYQVMF